MSKGLWRQDGGEGDRWRGMLSRREDRKLSQAIKRLEAKVRVKTLYVDSQGHETVRRVK